MVASTISSLEQLKVVGGTNLSGLEQFLEQLATAGIDITKRSGLREQYFEDSIHKPFLCCNIQNRFDDKSVMAAFVVLNPVKLPKLPENLL